VTKAARDGAEDVMSGALTHAREPARKLTYEEFLQSCDEDTLAEWVDGEVIMVSPASRRHQVISDFLLRVLGDYVEQRDLGTIVSAPFQMKTGPDLPGREPDILFVSRDHLDRFTDVYLNGPADLVVEIISRESRLRDRGEKLAEYEMGGVREYWIIDPEKREADFYVLGSDGRYERRRSDAHGVYRSTVVPDLWLKVDWLWQDPPPKALAVLRELGVV
jgi:Uma2 family endonuclease